MAGRTDSPLNEVAAKVVAESPQLRARMDRIVEALISDMELTIRIGSPAERAMLMKNVVPHLLRGMQGGGASAEDIALREAYDRVMSAVRGEADVDVDGHGVTPE